VGDKDGCHGYSQNNTTGIISASTYEPPRDDQIIVWVEEKGEPFVLAIFDEISEPRPSSISQRDTYQGFVQRFGPRVGERAVRLYQAKQAGE
jgi:hypothetical protein